jgi:hypothetical protein
VAAANPAPGVAVPPQSVGQDRGSIPVRIPRVVDGRLLAELLLSAMAVFKRWTVAQGGYGGSGMLEG